MLSKVVEKVDTVWNLAQRYHKDYFDLTMKHGTTYHVKHVGTSFSIYDKRNKLIANDISNTEDLSNCLVMLSNTKR